MQPKEPLLSIIIPVYNRQEGLNLLLEKLLISIEQEYLQKQVEIIIIDDHSQPVISLPSSLKNVAFIKLYQNNKNKGAPLSRKKGFNFSSGRFIHFHDSDDSIADNWLARVTKELTSNPQLGMLLTWRLDIEASSQKIRTKPFFRRNTKKPNRIKHRLNFTNIIGPLGGVTFSKKSLENVSFKNIASSQDWLMYIEAMQEIKTTKELSCLPDTHFIFNKTGDDRISLNSRKKILGQLQLATITREKTPFKKQIRLFYLFSNRQHIKNHGGSILKFYKKHQVKIFIIYIVISIYSFLPIHKFTVHL